MKSAMIAAMSFVLVLPAANAKECEPGQGRMHISESKEVPDPPTGVADWDRSATVYWVSVYGMAPVNSQKLQTEYDLKSATLSVGYANRAPVELKFGHLAVEEGQQACIEFGAWSVERPDRNGINYVTGAIDAPQVCIDKSGRALSLLSIHVNTIARPFGRATPPDLRVTATLKRKSGEVVSLLESNQETCID
ncbi:hypothetical protein ACIGHF_15800 [Stenotrophomonas sp. NPDC077464]|uniref:hypothetical protein n=1 Tax=unclassified Stenotrophomonas TaxID=196198 RepID=UPI0037D60737